MEIQIDNIISILSTLLTGGVLIILIETLHLSNVMSDRFYAKMKPFENSFISYINFVKLMESNIIYKNKEEHVKSFEHLVSKISKVDTKQSIYVLFTALELDTFCENTINGIWYYLSEKRQYVIPHIYFNEEDDLRNGNLKDYLYKLSPKYKKMQPSLDTLMTISGDFYIDIYRPVETAYFEFEYCKKRMQKMNIVNYIYVFFLTIFLLVTIFFNTILCSWIYFVMIVIFNLAFLYILYNFITIYNESVSRLK